MEAIVVLVLIAFAFWFYENVIKTRIEVAFVTMDDVDCSNVNSYHNHRVKCESKYCPEKMMTKISDLIKLAEQSIDIAMYNLTNRKIVSSILEIRKRNITVRLLMDRCALEGLEHHTALADLKEAGEKSAVFSLLLFFFIFLWFLLSFWCRNRKSAEIYTYFLIRDFLSFFLHNRC